MTHFRYIVIENSKKRIFHSQFKEPDEVFSFNRSRSIYQYSNTAPGLSGQTSIFGVVFFVSKPLLGVERQKKLKKKNTILTRKPRSHVRILICRTWPIVAEPIVVYF